MASFCSLVRLLSPSLMVRVKQGCIQSQGGDHIYVELIVHALLRYLVGFKRQNLSCIVFTASLTASSPLAPNFAANDLLTIIGFDIFRDEPLILCVTLT
jgi:hypothetical protein